VRNPERGQVLPLFALMLVLLFAMAALAIDVSSGYSARQAYRTASDAASLAGAQNLQTGGTRAVSDDDRTAARTDALKSLMQAFNGTGTGTGACDAASQAPGPQIDSCELLGTPFRVSIKTPAPTCVLCGNGNHAVQVTVSNPSFQLSFSRILGVDHWNVATTSVAGLGFGQSYALMTLRPPSATAPSGVRDIEINGGTHVVINRGDAGSNANMIYSGTANSKLILDPDYGMYYFDPANGPLWAPPNPADPSPNKIYSLILDPGYVIPSSSGGPVFNSQPAALDGTITSPGSTSSPSAACQSIVNTYLRNDPGYDVVVGTKRVIPILPSGAVDWSHVWCYKPGVYNFSLTDSNDDLSVLEPGLYFFNQGVGGTSSGGLNASLIGGYQANSEGVALVFPRDQPFKARNTTMVSLNAGTKLGSPSGSEATAAHDYASPYGLVQTNTTPKIPLTLIVQRDPKCTPVLPFPSACDNNEENQNDVIDIEAGSIYLAGVQYAPSDNSIIGGNSTASGYIGQIVAWTVKYAGGSVITQEGLTGPDLGILRLDAACTAPGTPCNP
jgi:Flp pilus assembly protein TadG